MGERTFIESRDEAGEVGKLRPSKQTAGPTVAKELAIYPPPGPWEVAVCPGSGTSPLLLNLSVFALGTKPGQDRSVWVKCLLPSIN